MAVVINEGPSVRKTWQEQVFPILMGFLIAAAGWSVSFYVGIHDMKSWQDRTDIRMTASEKTQSEFSSKQNDMNIKVTLMSEKVDTLMRYMEEAKQKR